MSGSGKPFAPLPAGLAALERRLEVRPRPALPPELAGRVRLAAREALAGADQPLEERLAARPGLAPPAGLRARALQAAAAYLPAAAPPPPLALSWWLAAAAAVVLAALNLGLLAAGSLRGSRPEHAARPAEVAALARQLSAALPELGIEEARRQALLLRAAALTPPLPPPPRGRPPRLPPDLGW